MPEEPADIEAEIYFLTAKEGGHSGPVRSGYRTVHDFGVDEGLNDALHVYDRGGWIHPGETVKAQLVVPDARSPG